MSQSKSSVEIGREAEEVAANWLKEREFQIIERNWRTRWCEIDIVAQKGETIHFVEVKYRRSSTAGTGAEYITWRKVVQMERAASIWVSRSKYSDFRMDVISVDGKNITYIPNAIY